MAHSSDFEIRWRNFRSYTDTQWLRIRPLTIIIGPNNCGKSNLVAPLLLLQQTWLSREDSTTPLVTNGRFIEGGIFRDQLFAKSLKKPLTLGLRFHIHDRKRIKKVLPVGKYPPGGFELSLQAIKGGIGSSLESVRVIDLLGRNYFSRTKTKTGYGLRGIISTAKMKPLEGKATRQGEPINFMFSPSNILYNYQELSGEGQTVGQDFSKEFTHLLRATGACMSGTQAFLNRLSYIGPLRQKPHRYYEVGAEEYGSVGISGEHAASLLLSTNASQRRQIDKWTQKLGFGNSVSINRHTGDIVSIEFADRSGTFVNIADLGFGVSQVFPLVVQAIAATPKTITIAEQPEIHLNPKLQSVLGDIFAGMVNRDQHVVVETHSEHLLLRIRTLIARGEIDSNQVAIYYIDRPKKSSEIRRLRLQDNGHITANHWPKGFFDDSLKESLSLIKAQSKRTAKRK